MVEPLYSMAWCLRLLSTTGTVSHQEEISDTSFSNNGGDSSNFNLVLSNDVKDGGDDGDVGNERYWGQYRILHARDW